MTTPDPSRGSSSWGSPQGSSGGCLAWAGSAAPKWPPSGLRLCGPLSMGKEEAARNDKEEACLFLTSCLCPPPKGLDSLDRVSGLTFWPYFLGNPSRQKHSQMAKALSSWCRSDGDGRAGPLRWGG